ncbi:MAG: hypothetical protein M1837_001434 [Sclerophora amabilis]|nr:MAG: hypothetical protein M1837_001434 [Sclerophora amabilis]
MVLFGLLAAANVVLAFGPHQPVRPRSATQPSAPEPTLGFTGMPRNNAQARRVRSRVPTVDEALSYYEPFDRTKTIFWTAYTESYARQLAARDDRILFDDKVKREYLYRGGTPFQKEGSLLLWKSFAVLARGTVYVTVPMLSHAPLTSWWCQAEWPILVNNPAVTSVMSVWVEGQNTEGGAATMLGGFRRIFRKVEYNAGLGRQNPADIGNICNEERYQQMISRAVQTRDRIYPPGGDQGWPARTSADTLQELVAGIESGAFTKADLLNLPGENGEEFRDLEATGMLDSILRGELPQ